MRFTASLRIGTFFRTRIRIHYTWLLVFLLIPWAVSTQYSTEMSLALRMGLGLITAALFFFAVFLREIALLIIAAKKDIHVQILTIFAFGGLIKTDHETDAPSLSMLLAVSGMLCNFAITGLFYFASLFLGDPETVIMVIPLRWLAFFYLTLSLFHIIPAYPLEGGRIVHVLIWKITGRLRLSTRIAGVSGWLMGFLVMIGGLMLVIFTEEMFTGLFFVGLGLIMQNAATHAIRDIQFIPDEKKDEPEQIPAEPEITVISGPPDITQNYL